MNPPPRAPVHERTIRRQVGWALVRASSGLSGATSRWLGRFEVLTIRAFGTDTLLYGVAAVIAGLNLVVASGGDYRAWAVIATPLYALAAIASIILDRVGDAARATRWRHGLTLVLLIGVVVVPLGAAVVARALALPGLHAQAEVAVIERCGDRVLHGHDCYLTHPTTAGTPAGSASPTLDANAFVPYLPGMALFGLPNGLPLPTILRDARVWMSAFTVAVLAVGAWLARLAPAQRWRLLLLVVVLPAGALPMVTGGDDLPVIALLATGLLLAETKPRTAGAALGLAMAFKLTAWPIVALVLLVRDPAVDRRRLTPPIVPIGGGITLLGAAINLRAFVTNDIRFPLGLTSVRSPAQSPLLGQALVSLAPSEHRIIVVGLVAIGLAATLLLIRAAWPLTIDRAILVAALVLLLATVLAPQTRFGYLLYPFDLLAVLVLRRSSRMTIIDTDRANAAPQPVALARLQR